MQGKCTQTVSGFGGVARVAWQKWKAVAFVGRCQVQGQFQVNAQGTRDDRCESPASLTASSIFNGFFSGSSRVRVKIRVSVRGVELVCKIPEPDNQRVLRKDPLLDGVYQHPEILSLAGRLEVWCLPIDENLHIPRESEELLVMLGGGGEGLTLQSPTNQPGNEAKSPSETRTNILVKTWKAVEWQKQRAMHW